MLSIQEEVTAACSPAPIQTLITPESKETGYLSQMRRLIISCFPVKIVKSFTAKTISLKPIRNKELSVDIVSILQNEETRISSGSNNDINSFSEKLKACSNDKVSNNLEELEKMRKVWSRADDHLCSNPAGGFHHYMWAYLVESSEGYSKYKELRTNLLQANALIKYLEALKATRAAAETLERS